MHRYVLPAAMIILTAGVLLWAWSLVQKPKPAPPPAPAPIAREAFDGTQPLVLRLRGSATDELHAWLKDELAYVLPRVPGIRFTHTPPTQPNAFVLEIETDPQQLGLRLIAPDGFLERKADLPIDSDSRYATMQSILQRLPEFLGIQSSWGDALGIDDPAAYQVVTRARASLRAADVTPRQRMRLIDQLERVTRQHPKYVRAWCALSLTYLQLESEDAASLQALAVQAAERALALDEEAADAYAVLGWVQYRAAQWLTAHEELTEAIDIHPESAPALEALGCLLTDAGLSQRAIDVTRRALAANPNSVAARECAAFATAALGETLESSEDEPFAVARLAATIQMMTGKPDPGRTTYEAAARRERIATPWLNATIAAIKDPSQTARALRALTFAESEERIDPTTEMLAGLALNRRDFVLNRAQRLQRTDEYVPWRVMWLPQAQALRRHPDFVDIAHAANLPAFWQTHGLPDVCEEEPRIAVCR